VGRKQRPLLMGSNLKMFKTAEQTRAYLEALQNLTADIPRTEVQLFIIPSYIALPAALQQVDQNLIRIGAQNVFWEDAGAWTGEVSPVMLKDLGVTQVELGHSERREHFGETALTVQRKVQAVLRNGMHALICVGETAQDKELGVGPERLREQVKIALHGVPEEALEHIWIAYEPVWAIGERGVPATAPYANAMHGVIRTVLTELYPNRGAGVPVLYGGSVNLENAESLIEQPDVDGLFVGRSAWDAERFNEMIRRTLKVWKRRRGGEKADQ